MSDASWYLLVPHDWHNTWKRPEKLPRIYDVTRATSVEEASKAFEMAFPDLFIFENTILKVEVVG